ncbi:MAG TPA: PIN domain-containing protein [Planctomycetota bacterium]|nr:PIN domain-containing protein [Planctomycetota bacterium]
MSVLVDTTIWSLALRRNKEKLNAEERQLFDFWTQLVITDRVKIIGSVRTEVLSGVREVENFERLKDRLAQFEDLAIDRRDYERAAEYYNNCRRNGIQASHVDMLICSAAQAHDLEVFTTDPDFEHYSRVLGTKLFKSP